MVRDISSGSGLHVYMNHESHKTSFKMHIEWTRKVESTSVLYFSCNDFVFTVFKFYLVMGGHSQVQILFRNFRNHQIDDNKLQFLPLITTLQPVSGIICKFCKKRDFLFTKSVQLFKIIDAYSS